MNTKLTAQEALKLFQLWEDLILSGELPAPPTPTPPRPVKSEQAPYALMFNAFVGALDLMELAEIKEAPAQEQGQA